MALQGQAALVLGGASGIGLASVQELLCAGASVAVGDVSVAGEGAVKQLQEEFGAQRVFFIRTDVCSDGDMENAFTITKERFKRLDILVNSAGIFYDTKWNLEVDTNLKGVIRGSLLAWKHMGKHEGGKGGVVVNIASVNGLDVYSPSPVYGATKHAVVAFGISCGMGPNLQHTGVRFFTMCPGLTSTPMVEKMTGDEMLLPHMKEEMVKIMGTFVSQRQDNVAKGILHAIQHGESGSVWVSEDNEPAFEVAFPGYKKMRIIH